MKVFRTLSDAAKVPQIRFHDLRHTCGTFLHAQGVSPFVIQEILGHAQIVTTRRYTHANKALQKDAVNKIGEMLKTQETADSGERSAVKVAVKPRLMRVK